MACALALVVTGCGENPVVVESPRLSAEDAAACAGLLEDLPDVLHDEERRLVAPAAAPGAAWGDPAIVLQCGAPLPEDLDRLSACLVVEGVGWFVPPSQEEDMTLDVVLTAVTVSPRVSVTVPAERRGPSSASILTEISPLVAENLPAAEGCA